MSKSDPMTTEDVNALVTATLQRAVADGLPLMEAIGAALSALAVFSCEREGPWRAGIRLQHLGNHFTSPEMLARHARGLN